MFECINSSRYHEAENPEAIAANAISILNYMKVPFSNYDFSRVVIPNANLMEAILDHTIFNDANLYGVDFRHAYLNRT